VADRMTAGTFFIPNNLEARSRRSPAINWYPPRALITTNGWMMPWIFIEFIKSSSALRSKFFRGWCGLGWISLIGKSCVPGLISDSVVSFRSPFRGGINEFNPLPKPVLFIYIFYLMYFLFNDFTR
jgi:hypothetical protein